MEQDLSTALISWRRYPWVTILIVTFNHSSQVAIAFHNMRQVDQAVTYFKQLGTVDPYRLDNLDTYSNLLYVKEQRVELAHLAHRFVFFLNGS